MAITKLKLGDGREVFVQEVQFDIGREDWNEYKLLDGGRVRVKTTVQRIFKQVTEDGQQVFDVNGDPEMVIRHSTQVVSTDIV